MNMTTTIPVKKREYMRLKKLDKSFGKFVNYFRELTEIEEARKQIREKKTIPQEKLFKRLGI